MLELSLGTQVQTADGRVMGEIDRFVVHPSRKEVTHVVVRRGALFTEERVVPVDVLGEEDGVVRLRSGIDPAELPSFERGHYVEMDPATSSRLTPRSPNALVWAYPIPSMTGFPAYPSAPIGGEAIAESRVPEGDVLVSEGAPVRSADGTEIGTISEVAIDSDGSLSYIEVDPGFFQGEEKIPSHWIDSLETGSVVLAVGDETLKEFGKL